MKLETIKLEQGKLVHWKNSNEQQIIWMICDDNKSGVVIHSDNLVKVGTINNLNEFSVMPFVGSLTITSMADK